MCISVGVQESEICQLQEVAVALVEQGAEDHNAYTQVYIAAMGSLLYYASKRH